VRSPASTAGTADDGHVRRPSARKRQLAAHFDDLATGRRPWKRSRAYHAELEALVRFLMPAAERVLEIGSGRGDLLAAVGPPGSLGVDLSPAMVAGAAEAHPSFRFAVGDAESLEVDEVFDWVVATDLVGYLDDVQTAIEQLHRVTSPDSRIVLTYINYLWEPLLRLAQALRLTAPQRRQNWVTPGDVHNLLYLAGFDVIRSGYRLLFPLAIPGVSWLANRVLAKLPGLRRLCLVQYVVARPAPGGDREPAYSVSVVIPCRNERGNIENAVTRMPRLGRETELIFVDGNSTDGTVEEIQRVQGLYGQAWRIRLLHQGDGTGKGDAVRKGFQVANGDVLMILDADLTVPPEDLPRFYAALATRKGEFINGTRLVYPMEDEAMRTLNLIGNRFFSAAFTWLLDQRFRDTLCGTKVLFRRDYEKIAAHRGYFGDFDPFGDFDLIFGAARLNLKIVEVPVRYRERTYGTTNIRRFRHGWLLLRMCLVALHKLKLK
jgi:SAM-dependent methyltransferase